MFKVVSIMAFSGVVVEEVPDDSPQDMPLEPVAPAAIVVEEVIGDVPAMPQHGVLPDLPPIVEEPNNGEVVVEGHFDAPIPEGDVVAAIAALIDKDKQKYEAENARVVRQAHNAYHQGVAADAAILDKKDADFRAKLAEDNRQNKLKQQAERDRIKKQSEEKTRLRKEREEAERLEREAELQALRDEIAARKAPEEQPKNETRENDDKSCSVM